MMGRSHALCGLIAGASAATVLEHAPLLVRLLIVPVTGGAALLPDIDHPSSRVARSLGFVTKWIAHGVAHLSLTVYHATRAERDTSDRHSGHRTLTHTVPGCVTAGVGTGVSLLVHPALGVVVLALLCGLLAQGFRSIGVGFTLGSAVVAWLTVTHYPGWSWLWPLVVTLGSLVHVAGDWVTNSGVPLYWPLTRDGKRWSLVHAPATFSTGQEFETHVIGPALYVGLTLAAGFMVGVPQALVHAWMTR
jgi:membrane-bound metal-dependent hydrolase YbcI (DUF457 family)